LACLATIFLETPYRAVSFRAHLAGVAQLVEHFLAKEDVARSNRVTRSPPRANLRAETTKKKDRQEARLSAL
jgi:hypothetical protein